MQTVVSILTTMPPTQQAYGLATVARPVLLILIKTYMSKTTSKLPVLYGLMVFKLQAQAVAIRLING